MSLDPSAAIIPRLSVMMFLQFAIQGAWVPLLFPFLKNHRGIDQTTATFSFGGTSLLIVIGVALDTVRQARAQAVIRNYGGYLKQAA